MKDWVKPYILQRITEYLNEFVQDEPEKERWLALKSKALEDTEILYYELTSYLNCHFGRELGDPQEFFYKVFGSVLADLPEEIFKKLCNMKNLFFTYTPNPGAEVKIFELEYDIKEGNLEIITFPYRWGFLPPNALRGVIVHELVHIYTGLGAIIDQEDQIDSIATEWGFREEIKAAKKYKKQIQLEERRQPFVVEKRVIPPKTPKFPLLAVMKGKKGSERTVYEIKPGVTCIGRDTDNDIVLKDPYVSKHHVKICCEADCYFLYDCGSTNGTRLNGRKIDRKKLVDLDIIEIGRASFTFISNETCGEDIHIDSPKKLNL
jgi:hypothetical protein